MHVRLGLMVVLVAAGCSERRRGPSDGGAPDGAAFDGAAFDGALDGAVMGDGGPVDGRSIDGSPLDGALGDGFAFADSGAGDGSLLGDGGLGPDGAGFDASGGADAGSTPDSGSDAGTPDAGFDAGAGGGGCVSGASGTHALRFTWDGTSSGSVASVDYELNNLPDTSRWRVSAASMSIGYRPIFRDPFLGEGGLEVSGTVFIDVELSTLGLTAIRNVTIAIYGRSYNTTSSGSFRWQTFEGTGAAPSGSVSNSAPYEWYGADATAAFAAGDDGILLRLRAGPPSGALIVRSVEVCFDAS